LNDQWMFLRPRGDVLQFFQGRKFAVEIDVHLEFE